MREFDKPKGDIAEVTLLGTGGGYGESLVIHLGNDQWMIVDSCINPNTSRPLPLEYLEKIGVSPVKVVLIICTHWHDDHILGLSGVFAACTNADFSFAKAHDLQKFLQFIQLDFSKIKRKESSSSTREFGECLDIIKSRSLRAKFASQDRVLWSYGTDMDNRIEVISLSPSDATLARFDQEVSTLITEFGPPTKKIIAQSPNAKSVVIFLKLGYHRVMLGADLEVSANEDEGWLNIVNNCTTVDKPASLFKIPHHGSENGYHIDVWSKLLVENPAVKLTPWNKKDKLPSSDMLTLFKRHSDQVYITSPVVSLKPKSRHRSVEKLIRDFRNNLYEVRYTEGTVRSRIAMYNQEDTWNVVPFPSAIRV